MEYYCQEFAPCSVFTSCRYVASTWGLKWISQCENDKWQSEGRSCHSCQCATSRFIAGGSIVHIRLKELCILICAIRLLHANLLRFHIIFNMYNDDNKIHFSFIYVVVVTWLNEQSHTFL